MSLLSLLVKVAREARVADVSHGALLVHVLVVSRYARNGSAAGHIELGPLFAIVQHEVLAIEAALRLDPLAFGELLARLMRQRQLRCREAVLRVCLTVVDKPETRVWREGVDAGVL
jgi:hypothetical protein